MRCTRYFKSKIEIFYIMNKAIVVVAVAIVAAVGISAFA